MERKVNKVLVGYPPIESDKGIPLLSQNRQFQWFNSPTFIYPVIPATAATMLKEDGFDVTWIDAIAEGMTLIDWLDEADSLSPDVIFIEVKTPIIKYMWDIVDTVKKRLPQTRLVLAGDHVTALPYETFDNSDTDYIITGGDYDFLLRNLMRNLNGEEEKEAGIMYREGSEIKSTGEYIQNHDLDEAPYIDRDLTKWENYAYDNGNYKKLPGTYIMSGRDCWHHECTFCSWTTIYKKFRTRSPENVVDEIEILVKKYKVKEIMDDTGCFPAGKWLRDFCQLMIERGLNKKVILDCNMRFNAISFEDYKLMKKAGFRFILFGLESANQGTLDKIKKSLPSEKIEESCRMAKKAGLFPHITVMFGYPWENADDVHNTIDLAKRLMLKGYAYTMQATIVIPYPGTPLFKECDEKGILATKDWSKYDMRRTIMQGKLSEEETKTLIKELYSVSFHPMFLIQKLLNIRDIWDIMYYLRAFKKVMFGHLKDFS